MNAKVPAKPANVSDYFGTPPEIIELCERVSGRIEFDPFPDAELQTWEPVEQASMGWDGLERPWPTGLSLLANAPFSGGGPTRAAARFAEAVQARADVSRYFVSIACPGAVYWRDYLHPHMSRVAWLGRLPFVALRDMNLGSAEKPRIVNAGQVVKGNRYEIALVYGGPLGRAFTQIFERAGYPVSKPS